MALTKLSNSELANLVKQWKPSNEWDYDKNNKYAGTNIKLGDGSIVPYDAIVQQVLARYDQDKKNPTLAVKSGIELGISDDILKTLPGVDENALAAGKQLLASGAFNPGDTGEGRAGFVQPAAPSSDTYKARMAAGLDAYGYPPAQVEALRASGQYREPTTSLANIAQAAPAAAAPAAGTTPLSNITQAAAAAAPAAQKQYTDAEIINAINGSRAQGFNDQQIIQGAQANFGLSADRINSLIKTVPAPKASAPAAAQTAAQGPAVKDASGNIIGYQSTQGAPGAIQVQVGQDRNGPIYNYVTPPSGQNATQLQTGTDRAGNPIYSNQSIITPQAQQTAGQAAASTFVEPSWVKNAKQTIGTAVEPVYPMKTVHGGNQEPDTSQAPIGYRYDNGKSQYQYLDLAGAPTNLVNRGNLGEAVKTLAPIALAALGANFLAPALGELFGADVIGATTGGTTGGLSGLGEVASSAGNVLSAADIAALGGADIAGLSGTAASNLAASVAGGLPALEAAAGGAGLLGAGGGSTTLSDLAATGTTPATTQLTPAAIESLSGTAGYGTNAAAVQAAIDAGINPAIVGSGALGTTADLLAGTTGAVGATPGTTSLSEMIASGMSPGSAGAAGAASGALTGAGLAAAGGTGLANLAGLGTTQLTPAAIESLSGTAGYGTNASAVQAAIDAGINPAIVGSGAGLSVADLLAGTTGAGAGLTPAAASVNEMVASGLAPGSVGAAGAATGALTGLGLAGAAGTGLADLAALGTGTGLGATTALTPAATTALTPAAIESLAGTAGYGTNASAVNAAIQAGINPAIVGAGAAGTTANLLAGTTGAAATTPAAASINQMVASGTAPGSVGATGAATGALTGANLAGAGGLATTGSNLTNLGSTAATGANTSLMQQLQAATGLSGPQLAALLSGGVGAANAANLSSAINTGLDATIAANTASQGTLKDIYNQQLGFQKPYQQTGLTGLNQLGQLADTGYLTKQFNAQDLASGLAPNYDFMLQQGQMANQRAANVGGGALSGNTLQGLNKYTQDYAGNAYQNAFNNYQSQRNNIYTNLANMAGIGQTANTGAQAAGTAYGKGTTDLQTALANAQAAAAVGKAQALAGGTSGVANSTFLASLLGQTGTVPQ